MTTMPDLPPTAGIPTSGPSRPSPGALGAVGALYRLFLREQVTRGRLLLAAALGGLSIVIAFFIDRNLDTDAIEATVNFVWLFGLGLAIPILALVLASSTLGNLVEDETLVYLWMRPNPRWQLAVAAWAAAFTVGLPLAVAPVVATGALGSGFDADTTLATALAAVLALTAYGGIFTLLGLLSRHALLWGLTYIFIWEGFVARAGAGAARLSIGTYPSSVLARLTDFELAQAERGMTAGLLVPAIVAVVALLLTSWRLDRSNVA